MNNDQNNTNSIPGANLTPTLENPSISNVNSSTSGVIPVQPILSDVESIGGTINSVVSSDQVNSNQELKIDNPSPFDIGVMATPVENITTKTNSLVKEISTDSILADTTPFTNESGNVNSNQDEIVSVGKYLGYIILFMIPILGFIMIVVKSLSNKENKNISNFAKAQLILSLVVAIIMTVFVFLFGSFLSI